MEHANNTNSRRGNFSGSLVRNVVLINLIYSPDGTNLYGSRRGEFEGVGSV